MTSRLEAIASESQCTGLAVPGWELDAAIFNLPWWAFHRACWMCERHLDREALRQYDSRCTRCWGRIGAAA